MLQYTEQTTKFYKDIQKMMRKAGYTYKRTISSACEELRWTKGEHVIELSGWHGKPGWGEGRCILAAYEVDVRLEEFASLVNSLNDTDRNCVLTEQAQARYPEQLKALRVQIERRLK